MNEQKKIESKIAGSVSLTALASISGGLIFAMLFANLVRYIAATNALEQAAQKTLRCITPTDPDCASYQAEAPALTYNWYGSKVGDALLSWVDKYDYTASTIKEPWEATYSGYKIHKVNPPELQYQLSRVPVKSFQAALNSYEYREAHLDVDLDVKEIVDVPIYRPANEPNFPFFDPAFEEIMKNEQANKWHARKYSGLDSQGNKVYDNLNIPHFEQVFSRVGLDSKDKNTRYGKFVSDVTTVPVLDKSDVCKDSNGKECSTANQTGLTLAKNQQLKLKSGEYAGPADWSKHAYVFIKAFAEVEKVRAKPDIKWFGSEEEGLTDQDNPLGWGLHIESWSRAQTESWKNQVANLGQSAPKTPTGGKIQVLGGRDWYEFDDNRSHKSFHLVSRGAMATNKSGKPEDGPESRNQHWPIQIERGGSYRIVGFFSVSNGGVNVDVKFWHYFDNYVPGTEQQERWKIEACSGDIPLVPGKDIGACPAELLCNLNNDRKVRPNTCRTAVKSTPVCEADLGVSADSVAFKVEQKFCGGVVSAAVCDGSWSPAEATNCGELASNQKTCGWAEISSNGFVEIAAESAECGLADNMIVTKSCGNGLAEVTYRTDANYGNPAECPVAATLVTQLQNQLDDLNKSQPNGGRRFDFRAPKFNWTESKEFSPPRWIESNYAVDENGRTLTNVEEVQNAVLTTRTVEKQFRHGNMNWKPSLNSFQIGENLLSQRLLSIYPLSNESEKVEIKDAYPYKNSPEYEIPEFLPSDDSLKSCAGTPASIDERLRYYAARSVNALNDPDVYLETNYSYVSSELVTVLDDCNPSNNRIATTPPCTRVAHSYQKTDTCYPGEHLGQYSNLSAPNGPAACSDGTFETCFKEAVIKPVSENSPAVTVDTYLAQERGFEEVERALPGIARNCKTSGCANVNVNGIDQEKTSVSVSYEMPLNFPLTAILERSSITLERNAEEVREMALAGRFAEKAND